MPHSHYSSPKFLIWQKWFFLTKNNHKNSHSFVLVKSQPLFDNDNIYCLKQCFNRQWLILDVVLPITTAFCFPQKYASKIRFLVSQESRVITIIQFLHLQGLVQPQLLLDNDYILPKAISLIGNASFSILFSQISMAFCIPQNVEKMILFQQKTLY